MVLFRDIAQNVEQSQDSQRTLLSSLLKQPVVPIPLMSVDRHLLEGAYWTSCAAQWSSISPLLPSSSPMFPLSGCGISAEANVPARSVQYCARYILSSSSSAKRMKSNGSLIARSCFPRSGNGLSLTLQPWRSGKKRVHSRGWCSCSSYLMRSEVSFISLHCTILRELCISSKNRGFTGTITQSKGDECCHILAAGPVLGCLTYLWVVKSFLRGEVQYPAVVSWTLGTGQIPRHLHMKTSCLWFSPADKFTPKPSISCIQATCSVFLSLAHSSSLPPRYSYSDSMPSEDCTSNGLFHGKNQTEPNPSVDTGHAVIAKKRRYYRFSAQSSTIWEGYKIFGLTCSMSKNAATSLQR